MPVSLDHERALWGAGATTVAGIDEVGRGALAGPVSVGIVAVSRRDDWPEGLADSKELTPSRRDAMALALADWGEARAVGSATPAEIDAHGIVGALRLAGARALAEIAAGGVRVDAVLLDGKHDWLTVPPPDLFADLDEEDAGRRPPALPDVEIPPVTMVIGGDRVCASIAAGSVLAKVARDAVMVEAHARHPEYGWAGNKGYGAADHMDALRRLGATPEHRRSWNLPPQDEPSAGAARA